jgi:hypothetical protein
VIDPRPYLPGPAGALVDEQGFFHPYPAAFEMDRFSGDGEKVDFGRNVISKERLQMKMSTDISRRDPIASHDPIASRPHCIPLHPDLL